MSNQPRSSSNAQASSGSSNVPASGGTYERKGFVYLDMQTHPFGAHIKVLPLDESEGPLNDASGELSDANSTPNRTAGLIIDGEMLAALTEANGQDLKMGDRLILTYSGRNLISIKVGE